MVKKKKCYIYTRVSTAVQVDGYSPDVLNSFQTMQDYGVNFCVECGGRNRYIHTNAGKVNAYKREKVHDIDHAHILSGLLKCPCCGKSLYGNIAKAHSKGRCTRYYYYCENTVGQTGHKCTFRTNIEQKEMNRMTADNIYQLLLAFDQLYDTFSESEQRDFMGAFIESIDIYPEKPEDDEVKFQQY